MKCSSKYLQFLLFPILIVLFFVPCADAVVAISEPTPEVFSTANANTYSLASFTPAANSLQVLFVYASDTAAAGTASDAGNGLTWTLRDSYSITNFKMYIYSAQVGASPAAMVVTFDCTGDTATGAAMAIFSVTGHSTSTPVRQTKGTDGTVLDPGLGWTSVPLTASGLMAAVGVNRNPAAYLPPSIALGQDTNWTEIADGGYGSPNIGMEAAYTATGETLNSVNWDGAAGTWVAMAIEINDAAVGGGGAVVHTLGALGAGS